MALSVHIKKKLKDFELAVDFDMEEGIVGFLGSSGCGKSMTLKCIAGIETPDEGKIVLDDKVSVSYTHLVDPDVLSAGRTIGMSEWKIFWKVQLPIAWPGVISGAVLAFARGLGEFLSLIHI